ncbi:MAG: exo-alpha-sialidase, partial [Kiritimatiellae bacterium]|nr:exo-alpha-sialidase [Kiritimatiellia bacterium]
DRPRYDWSDVRTTVLCERSRDGGRTWETLCREIPVAPEDDGCNLFHEPSVAELADGTLVAAVRFHGADGCFRFTRSRDGGRTWETLARSPLAAGKTAPHLLALPDGRLLCTYGLRRGDDAVGVFAAFSRDAGRTWTGLENAPLWIAPPGTWSGDIGYPATVAAPDGALVTVFYAPPEPGSKLPCLSAARWRA